MCATWSQWNQLPLNYKIKVQKHCQPQVSASFTVKHVRWIVGLQYVAIQSSTLACSCGLSIDVEFQQCFIIIGYTSSTQDLVDLLVQTVHLFYVVDA